MYSKIVLYSNEFSANEFEKELIVTVEEEKTPDLGHHIPETGVE